MKKAVIITAVLLLIAGTGGSLWLKRRLDNQMALAAAQEQQEQQPKPHKPAFDKYDNGPADPQESKSGAGKNWCSTASHGRERAEISTTQGK